MGSSYYEKLQILTEQNQISIKLIVAPPRTNSTLLQTSLLASNDIKASCHEPFTHLDYYFNKKEPDFGYKNIYDCVIKSSSGGTSSTVVVKELSHRLSKEKEYQKLFTLTHDPVLFLIRNPLLTIESRIKKVIQTLPQKARELTQEKLLNYFAQEKNFKILKDAVSLGYVLQDGIKGFRSTRTEPDLEFQTFLLNSYAVERGFRNWHDLAAHTTQEKDYKLLDKVLDIDPARFIMDASGEDSVEAQIAYLEGLDKKPILIDSTEFRLDPENITQKLCEGWGVSYSNQMVHWGKRKLEISTGERNIDNLVWYDTLSKSTSILPPFNVPPTLDAFPPKVRDHIVKVDMPQYVGLFNHKGKIRPSGPILDREFEIGIKPEQVSKYQSLGVKSAEQHQKDRVTIKDIDPIFSVLYDPGLRDDSNYMARKSAYSEVLNLVREIKMEGSTNTVEGDFIGRRK